MAEEPDINKILSVPRQVFPIVIPPAGELVRANQFQPSSDSNPGLSDDERTACSHLHPYVMRSKKYGSVNPGIDDAPFGLEVINEDTWDRDTPPYLTAVAITSGGTIGLTPNITTYTAHGLLAGESVSVVFAGTNASPSIDGNAIATYVSSTVVSTVVEVALTVAATTGTMAIVSDGVIYDPVPRIYKAAGVTKKFARQVKYDSCGELYYIGPEVEIESCSNSPSYTMRTYLYGSATPGDTTAALSLDQANQDTWDRFTPPTGTKGVIIGELPRHYISGSGSGTYSEKIFDRQKKYDSCGELYFLGVEVLVETATNSGSGSAGGGI